MVWRIDGPNDQVGYCRVPPAGGGCETTAILSFPGAVAANGTGRPAVFVPAPNTVLVVAGCWNCTNIDNRHYRFLSSNNGSTFPASDVLQIGGGVGNLTTEGFGTWLADAELFVGVAAGRVKAQNSTLPSGSGVEYATGGIFSFGPQVVRVPATTKLVAAVNDLDAVKYGVYVGGSLTVGEVNGAIGWSIDQTLVSAEGDNRDSALNAGPNGVFLSYLNQVSGNPDRVGLRKFDPLANSFGTPAYIDGDDPADESPGEPDSFQDPGGRIHVVWGLTSNGGRLRYRVSDATGANFTAASDLVAGEPIQDPELAAGADGKGFAVWTPGASGNIRVVPLEPSPGGPGGGDPVPGPPSIDDFGIGDPTLTPGQGTTFVFTTNEAGLAVLTIQKRFNGKKVKRRGKRVCKPVSKRKFRRLARNKRCKSWRKVGEIRQQVTAGRNEIRFNGRIAGRKLRPGRYRARLVVTDTVGNVSRVETLNFRVVKKKKRRR